MRIKVFSVYHRKYPLLNMDCVVPINAGRQVSNQASKDGKVDVAELAWLEKNTISDAVGDNISDRNREWCEITALYWIWKHIKEFGDLSHVGFIQYRRFFVLNSAWDSTDAIKKDDVYMHIVQSHNDIETGYAQRLVDFTDTGILKALSKYDVILPKLLDLTKKGFHNQWEDWVYGINGVHISDLCLLDKIIKEKFPRFSQPFKEYLGQPLKRAFQMFILPTSVFLNYCNDLFSVLDAVSPLIDTALYNVNGKRTMGYLAEQFYGMWMNNYIPQDLLKLECPTVFVK